MKHYQTYTASNYTITLKSEVFFLCLQLNISTKHMRYTYNSTKMTIKYFENFIQPESKGMHNSSSIISKGGTFYKLH